MGLREERQSQQAHVLGLSHKTPIGQIVDLIELRGFPHEQANLGSIRVVLEYGDLVLEVEITTKAFNTVGKFVARVLIQLTGDEVIGGEEEPREQRGEDRRV
jgi:hypothetical protein